MLGFVCEAEIKKGRHGSPTKRWQRFMIVGTGLQEKAESDAQGLPNFQYWILSIPRRTAVISLYCESAWCRQLQQITIPWVKTFLSSWRHQSTVQILHGELQITISNHWTTSILVLRPYWDDNLAEKERVFSDEGPRGHKSCDKCDDSTESTDTVDDVLWHIVLGTYRRCTARWYGYRGAEDIVERPSQIPCYYIEAYYWHPDILISQGHSQER